MDWLFTRDKNRNGRVVDFIEYSEIQKKIRRSGDVCLMTCGLHERFPMTSTRCILMSVSLQLKNIYEPISKLFEEHGDAGELDKAQEVGGVVLPADE
jgi:hypothetical protein